MAPKKLLLVDTPDVPTIPEFGSESLPVIATWKHPSGATVMGVAAAHIPDADIKLLLAARGQRGDDTEAVASIMFDLAANRLFKRVCDGCGWRPGADRLHCSRLKLCSTCCSAWFCSEACMTLAEAENRSAHHLRCRGGSEAPLDHGPMGVAVAVAHAHAHGHAK